VTGPEQVVILMSSRLRMEMLELEVKVELVEVNVEEMWRWWR
jgi:hypothetical protein